MVEVNMIHGTRVSKPYSPVSKVGKLKAVGKLCKRFREDLGATQQDVADETGYTVANISNFECGHNDNVLIFLWYINRGLPISNVNGAIDSVTRVTVYG